MHSSPPETSGNQISFLTLSTDYYEALEAVLVHAKGRVLIVGWSFDDRVVLSRHDEHASGSEPRSVGALLVDCARRNPDLHIDIRIWDAPPVFGADQHISRWFQTRAEDTANLDVRFVPADSAFAARHEKYVLVDSAIAFLGGIDVTHARWDDAEHTAANPKRVDPDGARYVPYHDVQAAVSGPVVQELWKMAQNDGLVQAIPDEDTQQTLWPGDLPADATNATISLARTRLYPETSRPSITEIRERYLDLIAHADERIYIENQYFSDRAIADAIITRIQEPEGPDVIIIMSKELPDTLGRITMGANNSLQLSRLLEEDTRGKVSFYSRVAPDDTDVTVKVHSKLMIVDGRYITLGSANISRRSFGMDSELNMVIDAGKCDNQRIALELESRLCAQHCGLSKQDWQRRVREHDGSVPEALNARSADWPGLADGKHSLDTTKLPPELIEKLDMDAPPQAESALQDHVRSNPGRVLARVKQGLLLVLALGLISGAAVLFVRLDVDIEAVLEEVRAIYRARPVLGIVLTIASYWLSMALFVSILVPVVFFAALHGPPLGMLYSLIGLLSGAAIYYRLGLFVFDADWIDRFKAVRAAKAQLERIKPYGVWAVAISRMVPSGPFAVVNFVTGMLGFSFRQFIFGSLIGLIPGIVAFSIFGEIIQNVFTDPSWINIGMLAAFLTVYFAVARLILGLIRTIAGWASKQGDS
ncbi:MAG: hypothetical protein EA383_08235 [Spirochaetaceae bacterium]|nr:MAG: hypothetical protein EA383_08235 [Spirochaetaceae bacterium]